MDVKYRLVGKSARLASSPTGPRFPWRPERRNAEATDAADAADAWRSDRCAAAEKEPFGVVGGEGAARLEHADPERCRSAESVRSASSAHRRFDPRNLYPARRQIYISIRWIFPINTVYESAPTSPASDTYASTSSNDCVSRRMNPIRIGVTIPASWPVKLMIPPVVPIRLRGATSAMIDHEFDDTPCAKKANVRMARASVVPST